MNDLTFLQLWAGVFLIAGLFTAWVWWLTGKAGRWMLDKSNDEVSARTVIIRDLVR